VHRPPIVWIDCRACGIFHSTTFSRCVLRRALKEAQMTFGVTFNGQADDETAALDIFLRAVRSLRDVGSCEATGSIGNTVLDASFGTEPEPEPAPEAAADETAAEPVHATVEAPSAEAERG
jgi:hypothetical protein